MKKRHLRIVREKPLLGVCEYCNMQFPVTLTALRAPILNSVQEQFKAHKCKREDVNQAAAQIVREATKD
jgi:hypothetical protein